MKNIIKQVPRESQIKRQIKKVVFGKKMFCPRCGSPQVKKKKDEDRYYCKLCRKPFSLRSVTWLKNMKLSWQDFWLLLWAWLHKVPTDQAAGLAGLSLPTVYSWYEKFRIHLPQHKIDNIRLSGIIAMDEAYRGGKKKGYAIIGAKEKKSSTNKNKKQKMALRVIEKPSVDRRDTIGFMADHIVPHSDLQTDGNGVYRGIGNYWPVNHQYERHNRFEFSLTAEIEGVWGNLTTFIRRMYHHVTRQQIADVLREFAARQSYAEWFESPGQFFQISMPQLIRPKRPEWRGAYQKKTEAKINTLKSRNCSIFIEPIELSTVPSC